MTPLALFAMAGGFQPLQPGWPMPVHDGRARGMLLVDQMEYRFDGSPGQLGVDAEGWYGPDYDRLRYRLEGAWEVGAPSGEGEAAVLFSRLVGRWTELQVGAGAEAVQEDGLAGGEVRAELGLEVVVPQDLDLEAHVRVSHRGRVSLTSTVTKDWMFSQRLILQTRADLVLAAQPSPELDTARGVESAGAGLRLRYEARRELAPYVGGTWTLHPPGPSGGSLTQAFAATGGLRWWL